MLCRADRSNETGMNLIPVSSGHNLWPVVSIFIGTTYLEHYGARLDNLPANIVALVDARQRVLCAAGLRSASESFFSEFYLDAPVEAVISARSGKRVARHEIAEVANLASRTPSISVHFMRELILYGDTLGFNWAFFTSTHRLEKVLRRIQLPLIDLGAASRDRVPNPEVWGRYYDSDPKVFAIGRDDLAPLLVRDPDAPLARGRLAHG
jgi:hypothetical protein